MKIGDVMTGEVELTSPNASIQDAAKQMAELNVGVLPVGSGDRLVGMITDRDIAIRAVAEGKSAKSTKVKDVMTDKVLYRYEDDEVELASNDMAVLGIRRLPIVNREKRLVGILSLGDLASRHDTASAGHTLRSVAASQ